MSPSIARDGNLCSPKPNVKSVKETPQALLGSQHRKSIPFFRIMSRCIIALIGNRQLLPTFVCCPISKGIHLQNMMLFSIYLGKIHMPFNKTLTEP